MKLTIDSICLISSIINKMEITDDFINDLVEMGKSAKGKSGSNIEKLQTQIGIKVILKLTSKLHLVKDELVEFIATYKEIEKEEAKKIDIIEFVKEIMKDKEVEDFSLEQAFEDDDEEISAIEESLKNNTTTKVEETIEEDEEEDLDDLDSLLEDISNEVVEEEANKEEPVAEPSALDKYNIDTYLNEQEDEEEEVEEAPIQLVEDRSQEIEELKAQLALANQKLEEARNSKVEVVTVNMTEEACLERLAILEERLKTTKADLKINMKEYRPLKKVMDNLERYQTKLRRKENSLANKKVALYGVNKYVDIDKEQAEKVLNESELVDGLRLSVQHCEEVIELNKDRYPILAHTNKILTDNIANLEQDIESTKQMLQTIRDKKDGNNGDNGEDEE